MANTKLRGARLKAIVSCVPEKRFDNLKDTSEFTRDEVRRVVGMAGVKERRIAGEHICSSDLCTAAAAVVLDSLQWSRESVDALIMVTQSPDYFLPSTACVIQNKLKLSDRCAVFDVGLGCSGYPYGLWLAAMMISSGLSRVLVLNGETPSRFCHPSDRSVSLLFGDAGSATAIESNGDEQSDEWSFVLHSDGSGYKDMIIEAGGFRDRFCDERRKHFLEMNGQNVFNFTIKRVPALITDTLALGDRQIEDIDYFILHQSNRFIIQHLMKKMGLPLEKVPMVLSKFGNTGGPSLPLAITQGNILRPENRPLSMMLLGYGVGLSWGSALLTMAGDTLLDHIEIDSNRGEYP